MSGVFGLTSRIALVTGAGSGIGRAVAELLGEEGARVAVADINVDAAREVADQLAAAPLPSHWM